MVLNILKPLIFQSKSTFRNIEKQILCVSVRILIRKMRFAANISTNLEDIGNHRQRYISIANRTDFNFDAIEAQNPYESSVEEWKQIMNENRSMKWVLINSPPLFATFDAIPLEEEFQKVIHKTISYVNGLNVSKVHLVMCDINYSSHLPRVTELISLAARQLHTYGVTCVLEPLSIRPNYYLRSYDLAIQIIDQLKQPNVKVLLDTYHMQKLHGNLTQNIERLSQYVGHVQISQVPLRDNPLADGEINHNYVLKKISEVYDDYVGLEYKNQSTDSFSWLNDYVKL